MFSATSDSVAGNAPDLTAHLDDIFGDVVFTPDGDTVFLSEQAALNSGEGNDVKTMASRPAADGSFQPVKAGGGLHTTQLIEEGKQATVMGRAEAGVQPTKPVPFRQNPQGASHIQYAISKKGVTANQKSDAQMSERR